MKYYSIAIDGPAGAGKSSIAKRIAEELSFIYVDTGAMYRAMALFFLQNNVSADDEDRINALCDSVVVSISYSDGAQQVVMNGVNVTGSIRTEEVSRMASASSVYKKVRAKLVELQQKLASSTNVIMDGRDIASCVLPDADLKVFLTASVAVRAERRYKEQMQKGISCNIEDIMKDIEERDYRDSHRENSPLIRVPDAVLVDDSEMTVEETADYIIGLFREKVKYSE